MNKYIKLDIIKEEKIYVNIKIYFIYIHKVGFLLHILKGCIP